MSYYGWIIDRDHLGDEPCAVGTMGPRDISPEHAASLAAGDGLWFQLLDDDRELYYSGRIVGRLDAYRAIEGDEPLSDYGAPNAGCTEIRYPQNPEYNCG